MGKIFPILQNFYSTLSFLIDHHCQRFAKQLPIQCQPWADYPMGFFLRHIQLDDKMIFDFNPYGGSIKISF